VVLLAQQTHTTRHAHDITVTERNLWALRLADDSLLRLTTGRAAPMDDAAWAAVKDGMRQLRDHRRATIQLPDGSRLARDDAESM